VVTVGPSRSGLLIDGPALRLQILAALSDLIHVDVGGEGRYPNAININPSKMTLKEIARIVRPGGTVCLVNPNSSASVEAHSKVFKLLGGKIQQEIEDGLLHTLITGVKEG
jgi:DNA-binding transcriptional ArsR family regulator